MPTTTTTTTPSRSRPEAGTRHGLRSALSVIPAVAPLGIALGVALAETSSTPLVAWLSAPVMVAGAAQLVLFTQLSGGAPVLAAAAAAILLNARFVVYGAALARRFDLQPRWFRWLGPHYLVDQTYAMVVADLDEHTSTDQFRHYFVAAGTLLWLAWTCSVGIGTLAGPIMPEQLPIEIVTPATFVALLIPGLTRKSEIIAVALGGGVSIPTAGSSGSLALAAIAGAILGCTSATEPTP